jgi:predicted unusual protein kinase regulating ubiquinone biosynthesis (AarF/ABC1/UbiB family)
VSEDALDRIDRLIQVGLRLALSAKSGRVLLARIAAAIDDEWIPRPWGDTIAVELAAAHAAACEPIEAKRIERTLRDAWGGPATGELDAFDPAPVAITPTAQVHRGVLDGAPVAIKVQRPGLAAAIRQDLALVDGLRRPLGAAFPALDVAAVLAEVRERALDELDLESEAAVHRRFHRALRGHPYLTTPAPIMRLCSSEVLVSEWVDGVALRDAADPADAAARLIAFVIGSARSGTMYAAPHPDDVLVTADGRLAILDYGTTSLVDVARLDAVAATLRGLIDVDAGGFGSGLAQLGWLPAAHGETALALVRDALGELADPAPAHLDADALVLARDRLLSRPAAIAELVVAGAVPASDLWPTLAVVQLFFTIARLGAAGSWCELSQSALRDGWEAKA